MKQNIFQPVVASFLLLAAFFLVACPTDTEDNIQVLDIHITKENDSLLSYDQIIIKVSSKDTSFIQEVFNGKLDDPKKVLGLKLDPKVGKEFRVTIVGFKGGKQGFSKEITVINKTPSDFKDLPIDTIQIGTKIPEIIVPSDTSVAEGDSLRIHVTLLNPWSTGILSFKNAPQGMALDTAGYLTWSPNFNQGRIEAYLMTLVYANSERKIEKPISIKVLNVNRPPKVATIPYQKVREDETLTFKVEASDPDADSLTLTASGLPSGSQFTSGIFTWKPTVGQAGNYFLTITANDGKSKDSIEVVITVGDVLPPPPGKPVITSTTPTNNKTPPWTWITGNGGIGLYRYRLDNEDLSIAPTTRETSYTPPTGLSEDIHTLFVQESNANGAWSASGRFSIRVDLTAPGSPTVSSPDSPTQKHRVTWSWTPGNGDGAGIFRYKLDNNNFSSGTVITTSANFTPDEDLLEGVRVLYVQERDSAGNWSASGSSSVRLDFTPPSQPIVDVAEFSPTNNQKPTWTWKSGGGDGTGTYRFKLDDSGLTVGSQSGSLSKFSPESPLKEGPHTLYVQERDSAGNWSSVGFKKLIVDLTPPSPVMMDSIPNSPLNSLQPTWTWKSGGGGIGKYRCKLDSDEMSNADTVSQGEFSPRLPLQEGRRTLYVQEKDSAGNWSAISSREVILAAKGVLGTEGMGDPFRITSKVVIDFESGTPFLLIGDWDSRTGKTVRVTSLRYQNMKWDTIGEIGASADLFNPFLYAKAKTGKLFISQKSPMQGYAVTINQFATGIWSPLPSMALWESSDSFYSLAINWEDVPVVAYSTPEHRFNFAFYDGPVLKGLSSKGLPDSGSRGYYRLVRNSSGDLVLGFADSLGMATVMTYMNYEWHMTATGQFSIKGAGEKNITFLIGPDDSPHFAYRDSLNENKATIIRNVGSGWQIVGQAVSPGGIRAPSLTFTPQKEPVIAFVDEATSNKLTVMKYSGKTWKTMGGKGISRSGISTCSVVTDSLGVPYVAYDQQGKTSVMKVSNDP